MGRPPSLHDKESARFLQYRQNGTDPEATSAKVDV